jgi:hypothetical protein
MSVNKKLLLAITIISVLWFSALAGVQLVNSAKANLAMPEETVNYTITNINGSLWAKIDGTYLLQILESEAFESLPLVYPTPPGTTKITITMDETELAWSNYTEIYPAALHYTALGYWPMINCTIYPVPKHFTLKIHYEHPIALINGSYTFLYDLNISPYLSPSSTKSTAHFNIRMEINYTNLHVNTIGLDEVLNPVDYTIQRDGTAETITFQIVSENQKSLPGDTLIAFAATNTSETLVLYPIIILIAAVIATLMARIAYGRKHKNARAVS